MSKNQRKAQSNCEMFFKNKRAGLLLDTYMGKIPQDGDFQGQMKGFLGCKGHTWAETIEKSNKNDQV